MNKAKHRGSCQCCGRVQMLPNDVLSLHGYTVDCGFFNGTCRGAKELPYEKSCELIKLFIKGAEEHKKGLRQFRVKLFKLPEEEQGYHHCYLKEAYQKRRGGSLMWLPDYKWKIVPVVLEEITATDGTFKWSEFAYIHPEAEKFPNENHRRHCRLDYRDKKGNKPFSVFGMAQLMNQDYAKRVIDPQIKRIEEYIKWQQGRVDAWKLKPYIPREEVKAVNAQAFKIEQVAA